ncbi:MAG: substrate-binding domain-containing protein, partial [Bacteroidales bacterium]|nr:substrate-binding domain-containing protein [Bacteroidales bacterium]
EGYRAALSKHGIRISSKFIRNIKFDFALDDVHELLIELLHPPNSLNAIFCSNNRIAVACLECLNDMNVRIPQDVGLLSFDDIDLFKFSFPTITSIAQPVEEIGEVAFNIMLEAITNGDNGKWNQVILPVKLMKRKSSGEFKTQIKSV